MSLTVVWSRAANDEFHAAERWYAEVSPELAGRFVQAVTESLETIAQFPLRFPDVHKGKRRALVRRCPYSLIYLAEDARIVVITCFHGKRNPRIWRRR